MENALERWGQVVKQEVLSLAEGDVVVRWPVGLSRRSRRQFKAWLGMLAEELQESATAASRDAASPDAVGTLRATGRVAFR